MRTIEYPDGAEISNLLFNKEIEGIGQYVTNEEIVDKIIEDKLNELGHHSGHFYVQYSFCGGRKKNVYWIAKKI
jgi:hypothetical protein